MGGSAAGATSASFIGKVERFAGHSLQHRDEIETLLRAAHRRSLQEVLNDIVFLAKFIVNSSNVLRRQGGETTDTAKLAAELRDAIEKSTALLRTLVKEEPEETRNRFVARFLTPTPAGMNSFMELQSDLAWVKNYLIDNNEAL